jgi:acyl carrier protein
MTASGMDRFTGSRTELEAVLRTIWVSVLGVDDVQPSDDFFDLGGHSLLAIELVDLIGTRTGVQLTLADLQRAPTFTALADDILRSLAR